MNKKCTQCRAVKPLAKFIKNKSCKDGVAGTCKLCHNKYSKDWKRKNSVRLAERRREIYAQTKGLKVKEREERRKELRPLRVRCQLLRSGMVERSRTRGLEFDKEILTVLYLMERISKTPVCECCGGVLDISFKHDRKRKNNSPSIDRINNLKGYILDNIAILCWRCNNLKRDAAIEELRTVVKYMESHQQKRNHNLVYLCPECNSPKIEEQFWVDINTEKPSKREGCFYCKECKKTHPWISLTDAKTGQVVDTIEKR